MEENKNEIIKENEITENKQEIDPKKKKRQVIVAVTITLVFGALSIIWPYIASDFIDIPYTPFWNTFGYWFEKIIGGAVFFFFVGLILYTCFDSVKDLAKTLKSVYEKFKKK